MIKSLLTRLLIILINLLLPGTGLALLGHWRLTFITVLSLILPLLLLCFSRLIFSAEYIITLLIFTLVIYLLTTALCCFLNNKNAQQNKSKKRANYLTTAVFGIAVLAGGFLGFTHKDKWLGVHIYFVPSMSMHPTLKPGQFILVDTWAYQDKTPLINDVVVFEHGIAKQYLVKRITPWPIHKKVQKDAWFVTGDNKYYSQDSRYFGAIKSEKIIGQVKMVLVDLDLNKDFNKKIPLTPVR